MFACCGFWHSNQAHDRTHWSGFITPAMHDFAHIDYEILYGLFQFFLFLLFWHIR